MPTKKDLQARFGCSDNTVYDTLKACGLDTSQRVYTEEEIEERFAPARKLVKAGKTYEEVRQHFAMKDGRADLPEEDYPFYGSEEDGFGEILQEEIATSITETINSAVAALVPLIPKMVLTALQEQARNGNIKRAFAKCREEYRESLDGVYVPYPQGSPMGLGSGEGSPRKIEVPPVDEGYDEEPNEPMNPL